MDEGKINSNIGSNNIVLNLDSQLNINYSPYFGIRKKMSSGFCILLISEVGAICLRVMLSLTMLIFYLMPVENTQLFQPPRNLKEHRFIYLFQGLNLFLRRYFEVVISDVQLYRCKI